MCANRLKDRHAFALPDGKGKNHCKKYGSCQGEFKADENKYINNKYIEKECGPEQFFHPTGINQTSYHKRADGRHYYNKTGMINSLLLT